MAKCVYVCTSTWVYTRACTHRLLHISQSFFVEWKMSLKLYVA